MAGSPTVVLVDVVGATSHSGAAANSIAATASVNWCARATTGPGVGISARISAVASVEALKAAGGTGSVIGGVVVAGTAVVTGAVLAVAMVAGAVVIGAVVTGAVVAGTEVSADGSSSLAHPIRPSAANSTATEATPALTLDGRDPG